MFCVLAQYACVRALRRWGEGSPCNLKGKYKAHTKLGAQAGRRAGRRAGRQQERQGKEKVVGIC